MKNTSINSAQFETQIISVIRNIGLVLTLCLAFSLPSYTQVELSDLGIKAPKLNLKVGNSFNAYAYHMPEHAIGSVKSVEVIAFDSHESPVSVDLLRHTIAEEIASEQLAQIRDKVFFQPIPENIYEVSSITDDIEVHKLVNTIIKHGEIDAAKKARLEELTDAQAIVSGQFYASLSRPEKTKSDKPDKKGRYTYTTSHNLAIQVIVNFTDITTGRTASVTVENSVSDTEYSYKTYPSVKELANKEEMIKTAVEASAAEMVSFFAPYYFKESVQLEKPKDKKMRAQYKVALKAAQKGNLEEACGIFNELYTKKPADAQATFNMAAMKYAAGDYATAIQYFEQAMELDTKKKKFKKWSEQASARKENTERLAEFGLEMKAIDHCNGEVNTDLAKAN